MHLVHKRLELQNRLAVRWRLNIDFSMANSRYTNLWVRNWPIFAQWHGNINSLWLLLALVVSWVLMNRLSWWSLWFFNTFLFKDFWLPHWRLLEWCSLSKSLCLRFWWRNIAPLAGDLNEFGDTELQFLGWIFCVCGDGWFVSHCIDSRWGCVVELLPGFVPTVNSVLNSLNHLLVRTAVLIAFRLRGLSGNRSTVVFFSFPELVFIPACVRPQNVIWQLDFWSCVCCR